MYDINDLFMLFSIEMRCSWHISMKMDHHPQGLVTFDLQQVISNFILPFSVQTNLVQHNKQPVLCCYSQNSLAMTYM